MTKEPIIIDDVDVSKCEYHRDTHKELLADGNIKIFANYCQINNDGCYAINCYYKQLKRKEEELTSCRNELEWLHNINDQLKAENEELKKVTITLAEGLNFRQQLVEKLKQTLTEIKELLLKTSTDSQEHCVNAKSVILQKISEMEDDKSNN